MVYRFLNFELDAEAYELRRGGERVAVEAKSLDPLLYLVRHRERVVVTRERLLRGAWPGLSVVSRALGRTVLSPRGACRGRPYLLRAMTRALRFVAELMEQRAPLGRPAASRLGPSACPLSVGRLEMRGEAGCRLVLIGGSARWLKPEVVPRLEPRGEGCYVPTSFPSLKQTPWALGADLVFEPGPSASRFFHRQVSRSYVARTYAAC